MLMYDSSRTRTARLRHSLTPARPGLLQRRCACGGTPGMDGECAACRQRRLQRRAGGSARAQAGQAPPIVHEVLRSSGQPLDERTRAFMEPRFGHDFGRVRVHTDARAAESARAVGALAYTVGRDVVFGVGRHDPGTAAGKRLLAHELAHVVQNGGRSVPTGELELGGAGTTQEREAEAAARRVVASAGEAAASRTAPAYNLAPATGAPLVQRQSPVSSSSSSGGGGGAGPAPAPGGGSCRVDVAATRIGGILSRAPIWHLLVVYADSSGTEHFFRGGPGGSCSGVAAGGYGTILGTSGPYVPGTVDYPPIHSTTVLTGSAACGKESCFASELARIDASCTPYSATGPNSNTVARTLLANCGVPQSKPVRIAPGWGDPPL
jgi:hypothetical protein